MYGWSFERLDRFPQTQSWQERDLNPGLTSESNGLKILIFTKSKHTPQCHQNEVFNISMSHSENIFKNYSFSHPMFRFYCCCCFCSVTQSYPSLCDPMDCSTPGFPVFHHLPELAQTHVHWVSNAIQPCHPLSPPFPPAPSLSQHQSHIQWISFSWKRTNWRTHTLNFRTY